MEKQLPAKYSLLPYQVESVKFLQNRNRSILGLPCGRGKTLVALEASKEENHFIYIVCPASLKINWETEIRKWGFKKKFLILSYERFTKIMKFKVYDSPAATIIFDEVHHHLRSEGALRVKAVNTFLKNYKGRAYFLTGTPIVKGAGDLYNVFKRCLGGKDRITQSYWEFCKEHCHSKKSRFTKSGLEFYGVKDAKKIKALFGKCGIRFSDKELDAFSEKRDVEIKLDCGDFRLNAEELEVLQHWLETGFNLGRAKPKALATRQKEVSAKKIKVLAEMYEGLDRAVFFCWYRETAHKLHAALGGSTEIITGEHTMKDRAEKVQLFQDGKIDRLVVTISSCGVGLNLYNGRNLVFAEMPWTFAEITQCLSRMYRYGNKGTTVFYPVCINSIEEIIWEKLGMRENLNLVI